MKLNFDLFYLLYKEDLAVFSCRINQNKLFR